MSQKKANHVVTRPLEEGQYRIREDSYDGNVPVIQRVRGETRRIDDPHTSITILTPVNGFPKQTIRLFDSGKIKRYTDETVQLFTSVDELRDELAEFHETVRRTVHDQLADSEFGTVIEPVIWGEGSLDDAKDTPFETLTDRYDVADSILRELARYETRREKRLANGRPTTACRRLVKQVPYISSSAVESVTESYQTIEAVADAPLGDLQTVDGLGRKTAWRVKRFAELDQQTADKQIPDERSVERVERMREFALENGLVSQVIEDSNLSSYRGRIYYKDNTIKLRSDLERGGFEASDGDESFEQVLAHEIAHTLEGSKYSQIDSDALFDLSDDTVIELRFLKRVAQRDHRRQRDEVFTNFVSRIAVEPRKTRELFPNAVREFRHDIVPNASGVRRDLLENLFDEW